MANRLYNEMMNKHTTFKIGGPAETFSIPTSIDDLLSEIEFCRQQNITYRILGNGSNILVSDKGLKGFVIKLHNACSDLNLLDNNTTRC